MLWAVFLSPPAGFSPIEIISNAGSEQTAQKYENGARLKDGAPLSSSLRVKTHATGRGITICVIKKYRADGDKREKSICIAPPRQPPPTVILPTRIEPQQNAPRVILSPPTATMAGSISRKLPAMVALPTGWTMRPSSTQNPAAPRE